MTSRSPRCPPPDANLLHEVIAAAGFRETSALRSVHGRAGTIDAAHAQGPRTVLHSCLLESDTYLVLAQYFGCGIFDTLLIVVCLAERSQNH